MEGRAKLILVIETAKELSISGGMIAIKDKEKGEIILRPLEDVQTVMIDHHSARITTPLITRLGKNNASADRYLTPDMIEQAKDICIKIRRILQFEI
ncbi:MAG: hypothetical protein IKH26_03155 [Bacteroidaceae bacterium]|nr:hypothetical protein [Bacteroidaceae bacterium]